MSVTPVVDIAGLAQTLEPGVYALITHLSTTNETLQQTLAAQQQEIAKLTDQIAELKQMLFGRQSEKLPTIASEIRRVVEAHELFESQAEGAETTPIDDEARRKARRRRGRKRSEGARKKKRALRKHLPVVKERVWVAATDLPAGMSLDDFRSVGDESNIVRRVEHVREHLVTVEYVLETLVSKDNEQIITAKVPDAVVEGGHYGPSVYAHVVVSKCVQSLPLYRIERMFELAGLCIARSTLCSLFHRAASLLEPIYTRLVEIAQQALYVGADETRHRILQNGGCQTGWVWTLHSDEVISYVFSDSRSSQVAKDLLNKTTGYLHVDGYSAYNAVCGEEGRKRVGCWAHARRLFFKALGEDDPAVRQMLRWIVDLYLVEYEAASCDVLGAAAHGLLRKEKSQPILDKIHAWAVAQQNHYPPKSRMGKAITYTLKQWTALSRFIEDPKLRLDNNLSENALRIVTLGRKNFLFVGDKDAGQNLAILQTIVATCRLHDVNPYPYIQDMLIRVQRHPQKKIDELLPQNWKTVFAQPP